MTKENLKLEDMKYIDMYHFQMWEGKFLDTEQEGREIYIYANVSNFETETFEESEVRVYPYSYEDLYCADDYAMLIGNRDLEAYLKQTLLDNIPKTNKEKDPVLCGFVYCHGNKDFSAWEVDITPEDQKAIEEILAKYETCGSSERNVWDSKFSDVFHIEY